MSNFYKKHHQPPSPLGSGPKEIGTKIVTHSSDRAVTVSTRLMGHTGCLPGWNIAVQGENKFKKLGFFFSFLTVNIGPFDAIFHSRPETYPLSGRVIFHFQGPTRAVYAAPFKNISGILLELVYV